MKSHKLTRQDVFEKVWNHYVVEGVPYAAEMDNWGVLPIDEHILGYKSPTSLIGKKGLHAHVDVAFLAELQDAHHKAVNFVFDNVENIHRVRNVYARAYRRAFRKTMKYFLIAFGIEHSLTIPSETALTPTDIRLAAKNKR